MLPWHRAAFVSVGALWLLVNINMWRMWRAEDTLAPNAVKGTSQALSDDDVAFAHKMKVFVSKGNSLAAFPTTPHIISRSNTQSGLTFFVIGDWGGPGRQPQQNVAGAMNLVATREGGTPRVPRRFSRLVEHPSVSPKAFSDDEITRRRRAVRSIDPSKHALRDTTNFFDQTDTVDVLSRLDLVISTGDNMYEAGVADCRDVRFKRNFEDVYHFPSLQCPWLMSLGNHDHGAHGVLRDVQGQVNYTFASPRWYLPSTHYAQVIELRDDKGAAVLTVLVVVLDSYEVSPSLTRMSTAQLSWAEGVLKASTADWRFIVSHRPVFSAGTKHGSSPYMEQRLVPLMQRFAVSALLSGDDHDLQVMQDKGRLFLVSGGGSRAKKDLRPGGVRGRTLYQSPRHGFMSMRLVNRTHMTLSVIDQSGQSFFEVNFENTNRGRG